MHPAMTSSALSPALSNSSPFGPAPQTQDTINLSFSEGSSTLSTQNLIPKISYARMTPNNSLQCLTCHEKSLPKSSYASVLEKEVLRLRQRLELMEREATQKSLI